MQYPCQLKQNQLLLLEIYRNPIYNKKERKKDIHKKKEYIRRKIYTTTTTR